MTPEDIISAVCDVTGVTRESLMGRCRLRKFTYARFLAWGVMRERAGSTAASIARRFSRDHSTIANGLIKFDSLMVENERFKLEYAALIRTLDERLAA